MSDPLLKLISTGLRLWVTSRCERVGEMELTLQGSSFGLLRGRLEGVVLQARDVRFDGLPLQHVELSSGALRLDLSLLQPGRMAALAEPFAVQGTVTIPGAELNEALLSERWSGLGDWMAERLLGVTPLGRLVMDNDVVELQAQVMAHRDPIRRRFRLEAEAGTVQFRSLSDERERMSLPMDPAIRITDVSVSAGRITLEGHASVTP